MVEETKTQLVFDRPVNLTFDSTIFFYVFVIVSLKLEKGKPYVFYLFCFLRSSLRLHLLRRFLVTSSFCFVSSCLCPHDRPIALILCPSNYQPHSRLMQRLKEKVCYPTL